MARGGAARAASASGTAHGARHGAARRAAHFLQTLASRAAARRIAATRTPRAARPSPIILRYLNTLRYYVR